MIEYLGYAGAVIGGFIAGAFLIGRLVNSGANDIIRQQRNLNYHDQKLYMDAMARNYAQIVFPRWPGEFVRIEEELYQFIKSMAEMTDDQLGDILDEISARNPRIGDFDKIGLRDYVLADGLFGQDFEELVTAYKDCCVYSLFLGSTMILNNVRRTAERYETSALDKEERFIKKYAREYEDSLFMHRCLQAMRQFSAAESERFEISERLRAAGIEFDYGLIFGDAGEGPIFKGDQFEVYNVHHPVEQQRGIKFLDTGECAVQGTFYGDDRTFVNWHRTNDKFEQLEGYDYQIWPLTTDFIMVPFDYLEEKKSPYTR